MNKPIIALDGDLVLFHYNEGMKDALAYALDVEPNTLSVVNPNAFRVAAYYGQASLTKEQVKKMNKYAVEKELWKSFPLMPGALEMCQILVAKGYELVCVTAMKESERTMREANIALHGLPISRVITAEQNSVDKLLNRNPKAKILEVLNPVYFLDDLKKYLKDIDNETITVFVNHNYTDGENDSYADVHPHMSITNLVDFATSIESVNTMNLNLN